MMHNKSLEAARQEAGQTFGEALKAAAVAACELVAIERAMAAEAPGQRCWRTFRDPRAVENLATGLLTLKHREFYPHPPWAAELRQRVDAHRRLLALGGAA